LLSKDPAFRLLGSDNSFYRVYEWIHARPSYYWKDQEEATVFPLEWTPGSRELEVNSEKGGRFVLVEQFFPGWQALVDRDPVQIERSDGAFQSIVVAPGTHLISFKFRPSSLTTGACLSALALVALGAIIVSDVKSRKHQSNSSLALLGSAER
jgi:uncharacterized membrane protein YfhO